MRLIYIGTKAAGDLIRLHAARPGRGATDGPFCETKELIGGGMYRKENREGGLMSGRRPSR
jgi:hypothetical protein